MNALMFFIYRFFVVPVAWTVFQIGAYFGDEKWQSLRDAKNSQVFSTKGMTLTEVALRRPFWIHAASGEIEYARPVIRKLKMAYPKIPILVTYGSPSAVNSIAKMPEVDAWGAVPWEFRTFVRKFLNRFQPRAVFFARTDVWPVLINEVQMRNIPSLLFSATFAENSSRLKFGMRGLTERTLGQLTKVFVVADQDKQQIAGLVPADRLQVAGDTRYDQVFHRLANPNTLMLPRPTGEALIFVAGSTWPEDELPLLQAFTKSKGWRLILAPHEITEDHLQHLEDRLKRLDLKFQRFSQIQDWTDPVLLVDRIGVLAELYTWGNLAFVGGSFKKQVHSVMEPLAAGLPVLVGPHHLNNREALEFQANDWAAGKIVRVVRNEKDFMSALDDKQWGPSEDIKSQIRKRGGATDSVLSWIQKTVDLT